MLEGSPNLLGIILAAGFVGLLPLVVVTMTGFLKISVVLFLVRNALGVQQMPPNLVLYGIALVLTAFVSTPVLSDMARRVGDAQIQLQTTDDVARAVEVVREPLKQHLVKYTKDTERAFFLEGATRIWPEEAQADISDDALTILIPAFVASELTRAFEIGFLIYLPFLVVDIIVANVLMALGMIMVSPVLISVPLKLLLFVAIDGWSRLMHGLILSYG